jgi:mRNA interferase RelE/StbE
VTYQVVWSERALDQAAGYLEEDPAGLEQLMTAIDTLADEPRPEWSVEFGSPGIRRMDVGRFRVLYDIYAHSVVIVVIHAGQAS